MKMVAVRLYSGRPSGPELPRGSLRW